MEDIQITLEERTEVELLRERVEALSTTVVTLQRENTSLEQRVDVLEKALSSALSSLAKEREGPHDGDQPFVSRPSQPLGEDASNDGDVSGSVQPPSTPLHEHTAREVPLLLRAAQEGDLSTVERLLQGGVAVDAADDDGDTALLHAAKGGHWELVTWLLRRGAAAGACNRRLESALEAASRGGHEAAVEELLRRGAAADPALVAHALKAAASAGVVRAFARASPDACRGVAAEEALRRAASAGREGALRALLAAGADPNALCRFGLTTLRFSGWRALHHAAWGGHAACVRALLAHGAHADARTRQGDAPLHLAARGGREACVHALLARGADPGAQNERGQTPRDVAVAAVRHALDRVDAPPPAHALAR